MPILNNKNFSKENVDFLGVFESFIALDIETSGLDKDLFNDDIKNKPEILEIGAVKVNQDNIEEFNIIIKNKYPVSNNIFELCKGLTQQSLDNGVELEKAINMLNEFIGNNTLICHNGKFENAFLQYYYEQVGLTFNNKIIDTMELAAVLEPYHNVYKLDYFIKNITQSNDDEEHRGLIDSYDTLCVASTLIMRFIEQGKNNNIEFKQISNIIPDWAWLNIIKRAHYPKYIPKYVKLYDEDCVKNNNEISKKENISIELLRDIDTCREFYNKGYIYRITQEEICNYMIKVIDSEKIGIIEAPVGTGKTMPIAVVSIILASKKKGEKVVIVTKTKQLMEDMLNNDLPNVKNAMGISNLKYTALKGKSNYLCLLKLNDFIKDKEIHLYNFKKRILFVILLRRYKIGEIEIEDNEINYAIKKLFVDKEINNETKQDKDIDKFISKFSCDGNCEMKECQYANKCKFLNILKKAEESNILIINQSLLSKWPYQFINMSVVICDESHELISEAKQLNTITIDMNILKNTIIKYVNKLKEEIINNAQINEENKLSSINEITICVNNITDVINQFYSIHMYTLGSENQEYDIRKFINKDEKNLITNMSNDIINLYSIISNLKINIKDCENLCQYLKDRIDELKKILDFKEDEICSIIANKPLEKLTINVNRALALSNFYRRCLCNVKSSIFLSGTLQIPDSTSNDSFKYFKIAMGLNGDLEKRLEEPLVIDSTFDYKNRMKIGIVKDAFKYNNTSEDKFILNFVNFIEKVALNTPSNLLVLFTNNKRRDLVESILKEKLSNEKINIYSSKNDIKKITIDGTKSILLGTRGFFQGVSLPGDRLNIVIVEKIPNLYNEDVYVELEKKIRNKLDKCQPCKKVPSTCLNCYKTINKYNVSILLKQISGRLLRNEYDNGFLIIYNGLETDKYLDWKYYRDLIGCKDESNKEINVIEENQDRLIEEFNSNIYHWIMDNIEKILSEEHLKIKERCLNSFSYGIDYKTAFEEALNTELRNKNLDYKIDIYLKDNGCIKEIKVTRKSITYNLTKKLINSISKFSKAIRMENANL